MDVAEQRRKWSPSDSRNGFLYDLVSSTDLTTNPVDWPVWDERADIAGTVPENLLTDVPEGGNPRRFFAVIEKEAPPLLEADFESDDGATQEQGIHHPESTAQHFPSCFFGPNRRLGPGVEDFSATQTTDFQQGSLSCSQDIHNQLRINFLCSFSVDDLRVFMFTL